ncbi:MAG: Acyl-CoA dehydrogenase [Myxococcota bacterium]|nr:Acyl-CoA dehydrogenase [Myxococcota bacterium]
MEFSFTPEQLQLRQEAFKFGREELAPTVRDRDNRGEFNRELWNKMGEFGLFALPFPAEYGGGDAGCTGACIAHEGFAKGARDGGMVLSMGAHTILCGIPIWKMGTDEQKQKYLPRICSGERIGGFCLTEWSSGSDAASMKTRAVLKGGKYILNGSKMFITNGPVGDQFIVTAVTDPGQKSLGISAFIVESGFPGFRVGQHLDKLGMRTSPTSELVFEDCEVPVENLLGPENMGFVLVAKLILGWERSCLLAPSLGGLEDLIETCTQYALERNQFRRPIARFGAIRRKIAEMKRDLEVARLLLYRVAWMLDNDKDEILSAAAMAKVFISEAMERHTNQAIQVLGGYGFIKDYEVERMFRDAKVGTIGGGTSEIQRSIIARGFLNI